MQKIGSSTLAAVKNRRAARLYHARAVTMFVQTNRANHSE